MKVRVGGIMKVRVRCSYDVDVELPDDWDEDQVLFHIEENGCPGTGDVGLKLKEAIDKSDSYCWACGFHEDTGVGNGENRVLSINGKEVNK